MLVATTQHGAGAEEQPADQKQEKERGKSSSTRRGNVNTGRNSGSNSTLCLLPFVVSAWVYRVGSAVVQEVVQLDQHALTVTLWTVLCTENCFRELAISETLSARISVRGSFQSEPLK